MYSFTFLLFNANMNFIFSKMTLVWFVVMLGQNTLPIISVQSVPEFILNHNMQEAGKRRNAGTASLIESG